MTRRTFYSDRILQPVYGTEPFVAYCQSRAIPFAQAEGAVFDAGAIRRWQEALTTLPPDRQADVEFELSQVRELSHRDAVYHLIDVSSQRGQPGDLIPGEAAQALWFLVHRPAIFQEVFFHHEIAEAESWRNALAPPGIDLSDHDQRRNAFERELSRFFRAHEGIGRFCTSRSYRFEEFDSTVFLGYLADRPRSFDTFTDDGEHRLQRFRPAITLTFVYYPADGTVLLKCRQRAAAKVLALFRAFSRAVLGCDLDESRLAVRYDLDRLKARFEPPLPEGVMQARVRCLDMAYPATEGRRRVRLETNASDRPSAISELLKIHVGDELRGRLRVVYAELQVTLHLRGRAKGYVIRLWPNRCGLNQTPAAETLRRCLNSWGLVHHAPRP